MHEDVLEFLKTQFPGPWEIRPVELSHLEAVWSISIHDLELRVEMYRGMVRGRKLKCIPWILAYVQKGPRDRKREIVQVVKTMPIEVQVKTAVGRAFAEAIAAGDYNHPISAYPSWVGKAYESWQTTGG